MEARAYFERENAARSDELRWSEAQIEERINLVIQSNIAGVAIDSEDLRECAYLNDIPIIADGGIKHNGDIAKALVAGAEMVMVGGVFTACIDSPAETILKGGIPTPHGFANRVTYKRYYGSASSENKGHNRNVEGFLVEVECNNMTYLQKLEEMQMDLQSAMSYGASSSISMLKDVRWHGV